MSQHMESHSRSSPDSSTADDFTHTLSFRCPNCPILFTNEDALADHLLHEHQTRLIKPDPSSKTRCPVCRQLVTDLSFHFAMEHSEKRSANLKNNNGRLGAVFGNNSKVITSGVYMSSRNTSPQAEPSKMIPILLPSHPLPESQLGDQQDDQPASPMNLSIKRDQQVTIDLKNNLSHGACNNNNYSSRKLSLPQSREDSDLETASNFSGDANNSASGADNRKRRKQTHVPTESKDEKYWARRLKNNEAAKRSRDMRIRREKVVFEENVRLEQDNRDLRAELDRVNTENKELHLKMGLILDENARLKSIIYSMQSQEEAAVEERL